MTYSGNALLEELNKQSEEIHFIFREDELLSESGIIDHERLQLILKKSILFSNRAIFILKPIMFKLYNSEILFDVNDTFSDKFRLNTEFFNIQEGTSFNGLINAGLINILPETITMRSQHWDLDFDEYVYSHETSFNFSLPKNFYKIPIALKNPEINKYFLESLSCHKESIAVTNVCLPELRNIPLEVLLKLREDESDSFDRFHYTIRKLIGGKDIKTNESDIKILFQEVDHEIKSFNDRLKVVKRSKAIANYEAAIGVSIMGLCFAMPSDIAKIITAVIGTYSAKDFIKNLFLIPNEKYKFRESDFYIPWKCPMC